MGTVLGYLRPHGVRVACGVTVKFTAALLELVLPLLLEHPPPKAKRPPPIRGSLH